MAALGRIWIGALALTAIGLLMLLTVGLLLSQRDSSLDRAHAQAQREVLRLAAELDQSLRLARAAIQVAEKSPTTTTGDLLGEHRPLVASLTLPFELVRLDPTASADKSGPPAQWLPELARSDAGKWVVPLTWHQPAGPGGGGQVYEVRLSREALLSRLASEGVPAGSSMSLFRVEDDGGTTVLTRHPLVEREQGQTLRGHLAKAVAQNPSGVFRASATIDGIHRIVGYQRLPGEAHRLLFVYALGTQGVLAPWTSTLPWAGLLTLLVAASMAWGAWRLDRSVRDLRRSERHFQTLASHLPDVVARYDREGRFLYANPAIEAANGHKPEALIGRTIREIGTPEPIASVWMACIERVFGTGQQETLCFAYPGPDGLRHWEAQVRLEPALPGEEPTVLVLTRNITERNEAERQRLSAQRLFEAVFQTAPEAMSLSEQDTGRLLLVNDAFCELFGRSRESVIGRTSVELGLWKNPQDRDQLRQALEQEAPVRDAEGVGLRPDGQTIDVRVSAELVVVDGQESLLLMFRDVTHRTHALQALARSELRFRLAAAQGQVWEWDFEKGGFSPSHEFFARLGYQFDPAAPLDQAFGQVVHPEDLPRLRWQMRRFLKGEADFRMEFRAEDAAGTYHWFDAFGSGLRDASGRVTYMAGTAFDISDRKALEEQQRQTLNQLETVTNASPALFWTTDADQQTDWINKRWLEFTGRTAEAEQALDWTDDLHPQDRARCAQVFEKAFDAREPYSMEYRLRRHDGQFRWVMEQGQPRYDADNRFIGYIGSCLDVSDQKHAEATALERGAMLEQVFDVLQDMLFVVDEQERFVFYQAGQEDRLYRPAGEFLGKAFGDVMPPELADPMRKAMARARQEGMQELYYDLALPDGTHHFNARLAWLPASKQCMFLVRDTTEQQAAHRERERLSQFVLLLFRLASRFINLPVQQMDEAINEALGDMGRFVDADRAYLFDYDFEARTSSNTHEWCAQGVEPEQVHLQNLPLDWDPDWVAAHSRGEMIHVPDVQAMAEGALKAVLQPQGIRSLMALPLMSPRGCLGYVGLDSVRQPHAYDDEEITLLQLFAQMLVNIRLRADAETRIHELTGQLEQKVVDRTAQLESTIKRLQAANRELESFTYSASHDLRTPLRGIEGFSALLIEEHGAQLDAQGREYLRRIQRGTMHMSQLITDLLAYAHLEQMTEQVAPVRLGPLVTGVIQPFKDTLEERQGLLELQVPTDLVVMADPSGLAMVLRNLLDNALKFTPADRAPQIRIAARQEEAVVHLTVSDNGQGFDMRHHDRIFGMFQRLHRQDQVPGTGIGLAMVSKAVERMGGRIWAESQQGIGSTFHVSVAACHDLTAPPPAGA